MGKEAKKKEFPSKEDYRDLAIMLALMFGVLFLWGLGQDHTIQDLENELHCGDKNIEYRLIVDDGFSVYPMGYSCCTITSKKEFSESTGQFEAHENKRCVFVKL